MDDLWIGVSRPTGTGSADDLVLKVMARVQESEHVVSLVLAPVDRGAWIPFLAGQHLPLRLDLPKRPIATYSISSSPAEKGIYRISVKREMNGLGGSSYLHEQAVVGSILRAARPRGRFHLAGDVQSVVLLTGGIGVTPAISMLKDLAKRPDLPTYFIHSVRSRDEHSFREEVSKIAREAPHISTFVSYDEASEEDLATGSCNHVGRIDRECLRRVLPQDRHTVYMCGPNGFMRAMRDALQSLGIPNESIYQEDFGGAVVSAMSRLATTEPDGATAAQGTSVHFVRSGVRATWSKNSGSLLDLAEQNGLTPDFSCRAGICGTCACRLVSGCVEYDKEPLEQPPEGQILMCCARPVNDVRLDL